MPEYNITEKLNICKKTREIAANSLYKAMNSLLQADEPISEAILRDTWRREIMEFDNIFTNGWYMPPPHGIGVLFGNDDNSNRLNFKSLRLEDNWPRNDVLLDRKKGIAYVYCSPVDKLSGVIGDFGMTIYFGKKPEIKTHLKNCYITNKKIFENIKQGLSLSQVYDIAIRTLEEKGLINAVTHTIHPDAARNPITGLKPDGSEIAVDIGHTIPGSYEEWKDEELALFKSKKWDSIKDVISKKRKFITLGEEVRITKGFGLTIEPRVKSKDHPQVPLSSYHTIALFHENGEKELLTNFDGIFKLAKMDYMMD